MPRACLSICLLLLSACAGPLPRANPELAWVTLHGAPGDSLLAERRDGVAVTDGRYFQLRPGPHVLQLRLQFELPGGNGREPLGGGEIRTCLFSLDYAGFQAGQHYRINAGQQGYRGWVRLYDAQRQLLARGQQLRCGGF